MSVPFDIKFNAEKLEAVLKFKVAELRGQISGKNNSDWFEDVINHIFVNGCRLEICEKDGCSWFLQLLQHECSCTPARYSDCYECFAIASHYLNHVKYCKRENCLVYLCKETKNLLGNNTNRLDRSLETTPIRNRPPQALPTYTSSMDENNGVVLELYDLREAMESYYSGKPMNTSVEHSNASTCSSPSIYDDIDESEARRYEVD